MSRPGNIYTSEARKWFAFIRRAGLPQFLMMFPRHFLAGLIVGRLAPRTICFKGRDLAYLYHRYNITWVTERAIEVPIAMSYVSKADPARTLEVGNVLGHYFPVKHLVVDKFEQRPGVVREDILEFDPGRKFDLIVSISTFEHIGYEDEGPPDPGKVMEAIEACRRMLSSNGRLVITVPFGYNPNLDASIRSGELRPAREYFYERTGKLTWNECSREAALEREYCKPFPYANAILVAEFGPAVDRESGAENGIR